MSTFMKYFKTWTRRPFAKAIVLRMFFGDACTFFRMKHCQQNKTKICIKLRITICQKYTTLFHINVPVWNKVVDSAKIFINILQIFTKYSKKIILNLYSICFEFLRYRYVLRQKQNNEISLIQHFFRHALKENQTPNTTVQVSNCTFWQYILIRR